jgi:hypothetical protein
VQFSSLRMKARKLSERFNLALVALIPVGLALLYSFPSGLGHSFAEAVSIASILGVTVDFYLKRRILREASLDISKFLLGYTLPQEIQDQIKNLMQTSLLRRDFEVRYEISRKREDRCYLKVEGSFLVENFTNEPQPYIQTLAFEAEESPQIVELRLDSDDERVAYCLREGTGLTVQANGGLRAVGPKCTIQPKAWGK